MTSIELPKKRDPYEEEEPIIWKAFQEPQRLSIDTVFTRANLPHLFFCFIWNTLLILFVSLIIKHNPKVFLNIFVTSCFILFFIVGIYLPFAGSKPLIKSKNKTLYMITQKKIIIKDVKRQSECSYYWDEVKDISLEINKNNLGNIYFNLSSNRKVPSETISDNAVNFESCFYNISNPIYVYQLIRQQMQAKYFPDKDFFSVHTSVSTQNMDNPRKLLLNNETIIWNGHPSSISIFKPPQNIKRLIFSIVWAMIALFMFVQSIRLNGGFSLNLFPVLLLALLGVVILLSNFLVPLNMINAYNKTSYIVTDKGISIYINTYRKYYLSIWYPSLESIHIQENRDESGTIYYNSDFSSTLVDQMHCLKTNFYNINNANHVYVLVKELYDKHKYANEESSDTDRELIL
ncbi:MAG: hypothetical protein JXN65_06300 [Clostridia bacterium]|nr:hypothetical protein [Clostridia bacterium]